LEEALPELDILGGMSLLLLLCIMVHVRIGWLKEAMRGLGLA
jgi:hypothetical protein